MIIIVDNREQAPYFFKRFGGVTVFDTLETGDYSIELHRNAVAVERKTLSDFYGSIGKHHERFFAEMERLASYQFKLLVVESDLNTALDTKNDRHTKLPTESVWGSVQKIIAEHQIPLVFASVRGIAEETVYRFLKKSDELLQRYGHLRLAPAVRLVEECTLCGKTRLAALKEHPDLGVRAWVRLAQQVNGLRAERCVIAVCYDCRAKIKAKALSLPLGYEWVSP